MLLCRVDRFLIFSILAKVRKPCKDAIRRVSDAKAEDISEYSFLPYLIEVMDNKDCLIPYLEPQFAKSDIIVIELHMSKCDLTL